MKNRIFATLLSLSAAILSMHAGERESFDLGWCFAFGDASSPEKDFGCGTEYFTYLAKAASIHNEGPYSTKFDPGKWDKEWIYVDLPHDWVVDLPFAPEASHSHGYKTVGYRYPETSVGWYRKTFSIPAEDDGKHISLVFDGIFRDSRVWVNGFYLGGEPSGYADQVYDITPYLNYGGQNLVTVRVDASLEEGWFYEGAGIYRHAWLEKTSPLHIGYNGTAVSCTFPDDFSQAVITIDTEVANDSEKTASCTLLHRLYDASGNLCGEMASDVAAGLLPRQKQTVSVISTVDSPRLWSIDDPYLYTLRTDIIAGMDTVDSQSLKIGLRNAVFSPDSGFVLNGERVKLKGVNLHQDHAGVGAAIPDGLNLWRLRQLKKLGINAIRSSHNPVSPQVLDMCDSLGFVVIDENRLTGVNDEHIRLLGRMIKRDRNHPSVILYSVGNEEWGIEWNDFGRRIVELMRDQCHLLDPTRMMTVASSSGPTVLVPADVAGYNYILQNPVDEHRTNYPRRCALGSEETTGCGTRGIYFDDRANGRMAALNRSANGPDSLLNCIERGWKFYDGRPWLGGLFYWTGFDYRGEPNPLSYPATGSEFGILDYCGFPKDEAWYLQSWWTDTPVLHILPHWNLAGHEGEEVSLWVYSNCDEVQLSVNGRNLGRKEMPRNGHLEWSAIYAPGSVKAIGYRKGRKVAEQTLATTGAPAKVDIKAEAEAGVAVCTVTVCDSKGRIVPDACVPFTVEVEGPAMILGYGNGDPAFTGTERPTDRMTRSFSGNTFNGLAQILVTPTPYSSGMQVRMRAITADGESEATIDFFPTPDKSTVNVSEP